MAFYNRHATGASGCKDQVTEVASFTIDHFSS